MFIFEPFPFQLLTSASIPTPLSTTPLRLPSAVTSRPSPQPPEMSRTQNWIILSGGTELIGTWSRFVPLWKPFGKLILPRVVRSRILLLCQNSSNELYMCACVRVCVTQKCRAIKLHLNVKELNYIINQRMPNASRLYLFML